jgi:HlyD family secretion protein
MSDVDLHDLKIRRDPVPARRKAPLLVFLPVFLIGLVLGAAVMKYWPIEERVSGEKSGTNASAPAEQTPTPASMPPPSGSFTEGGWIEVPSYHPIVVSSLVSGRLEELLVLEGSRVAKGEVIARIYDKDLRDAAEKAEAELQVAKADRERLQAGFRVQEVEKARADLDAAEADARFREQVLARTRELVESGASSTEDLERDEAAFRTAQARRDALRQELLLREEGSRIEDIQAAEAEVKRRLALLELARNQLGYATVRSPADGIVLERFVTPGTHIPADSPRIVSLYDPDDLQVRVDVRQENIGLVFVGQQVEIFTDSEPGRAYAGTVIRLEPLADFKKNTIQVKVKIHDPSRNLYPEMIARIRFKRNTNDQGDGQN